jgi:hypothetical protein
MSEAYTNPAVVISNETALHGYGDIEAQITGYHQEMAEVKEVGEGDTVRFQDVDLEFQTMFHSDPKTVGFTAEDDNRKIGFWTDTEYSEELTSFYTGCDVLVVFCSRPRGKSVPTHTSLDQVPDILEHVSPEKVIITHFDHSFLEEDLESQREWLESQVDASVLFAEDGMEYPGNRSLESF